MNLRSLSWLLGVASIALPGFYLAIQLHEFNKWAATQGDAVCGLPILGFGVVALASCGFLSLIAFILNGVNLRQSARPRSIARYVELTSLLVPVVVCIALVIIVFIA